MLLINLPNFQTTSAQASPPPGPRNNVCGVTLLKTGKHRCGVGSGCGRGEGGGGFDVEDAEQVLLILQVACARRMYVGIRNYYWGSWAKL